MSSEPDMDPYDQYDESFDDYQNQEPPVQSYNQRPPTQSSILFRRLVIILVLGIVIVALCYVMFGADAIIAVVDEYWPLALCPLVGWLLGHWAVMTLYRPSGRVVFALNPRIQEARVVFIPERLFPYFKQAGNNVAYHTPLGNIAYIAKSLDMQKGDIDYGWVHDLNPWIVFSDIEAWNRWEGFIEDVLRENNQLKHRSIAIALSYVRQFVTNLLNDIGVASGIMRPDYSHNDVADGPEEKGDDNDDIEY